MPSIFLLICILSFVLSLVNAAPIVTNAQRLQRGLPVRKPNGYVKRIVNGVTRTVPGANVLNARWGPHPSQSPPSVQEGIIQVNGLPWGGKAYVGKTLSPNGTYPLTHTKADALIVKFDSTQTSIPGGLVALNNHNSTFPWVGFAAAAAVGGESKLGQGSDVAVLLVGISIATDPHSAPEPVADSLGKPYLGSETDIWTLSSTLRILAKWINPNGSLAQGTIFFYVANGDFFGLTGDLGAYNKAFPHAPGVKVTFTLISVA